MHPVYEASATLVISVGNPASGGTESSIAAIPTYAQLLTNPLVLNPVVAKHSGMTLQQLNAMMLVKPQTSTQILATLVEAVLLVVDASKTPRRALLRAKRLLNKTSAVKLGALERS